MFKYLLHLKTGLFWFCFAVFLLFDLQVLAQSLTGQKRLDSLLNANQNYTKADSNKVKTLTLVLRQYMRMKNFEKAEFYAAEALPLARKLNLPKLTGWIYYRLGAGYHIYNFLKSEDNYQKAIREFAEANDQDILAGTYLNLGALYMGLPDYAKSLEANQQAIAIYMKNGNQEDLASCYANVANIYHELGQEAQSIQYLKQALKIFSADGTDNRGTSVAYESMAMSYFSASDQDLAKLNTTKAQQLPLALDYLKKALKAALLIEDNGLQGSINSDLGKVYERMGNKDLALSAYLKSVDLNQETDDMRDYANVSAALGSYYQRLNNYDEAIKLLNQALKVAEKNNLSDIERDVALDLSRVYEKLGNYSNALQFYKQSLKAKEIVFNEEKEKEITRRQMQLEFGIKENEYQLKQKITNVELQRQVLLASQQQQQLTLRQQQLALSDKEKTLQRLTFLNQRAKLENERRLQTGNFQRANLLAKYQTSLRDKQISKQNQQIEYDGKVKLFLILAIGLALFAAGLIYFNQRKTRRLNTIINQQKVELEQLSKVKDRIFSVVSHDLRTPVNSLISFIQLLEDGNINQEKLKRYAASLKNSLSYTSSMMENLLNWAASQMQGFNPYLEPLKIRPLTEEVLNSLKGAAEAKHIEIRNLISEDAMGIADANMFSLVLRNLIGNAIKFTPEQGCITIAADQNQKGFVVAVTDNGIGMSAEQVNHFNKSAYQGAGQSTPGTNREKGTGLGLLLCRTFMAMMDGKITVQSDQAKGSQFTIWLKAA